MLRNKHAVSWKLINEISGRKTAKKGVLTKIVPDRKEQPWYISSLLGE